MKSEADADMVAFHAACMWAKSPADFLWLEKKAKELGLSLTLQDALNCLGQPGAMN